MIKVMLEAALKLVEVVPPVAPSDQVKPGAALPARMRRIITASKPKPRR